MKPSRLPLDWFACGLMFVLCICWGFQQVAIKLTLDDVPSILQLAIRSGGAALVLGALVLWKEGRGAFNDGTLRPGCCSPAPRSTTPTSRRDPRR